MKSFGLKILTPTSDFYSGEIEYLELEAPDGRLGLMSGGEQRVAPLVAGKARIRTAVLDLYAYLDNGFYFVGKDGVTVLTESAAFDPNETDELDRSFDAERSERAFKLARAEIGENLRRVK